MTALERKLDALRVRMKIARSLEMAVRWTFYASFLACVCLAAAKFGTPSSPAVPLLVALPLVAGALALARPATRRDAAIATDRVLLLEERVATALETGRDCVVRDAERVLAGRDLRQVAPLRLPREGGFLAFSLPLAAALAVVSAPRPAAPEDSPLARGAAEEARRLEALPAPEAAAGELRRIAADLKSGDPERIRAALAALAGLEAEATRRLLEGGDGDAASWRALADQAAASGTALGRFAPAVVLAPGALAEKLNRSAGGPAGDRSVRPAEFAVRALPEGASASPGAERIVGESLSRRDWDPRHDALVQAYYEVR